MPRKSSIDSDLVKKAVDYIIKHPTLPTSDAMYLAGFPKEETTNKSVWKLITRRLPGKTKRDFRALSKSASDSGPGAVVGQQIND